MAILSNTINFMTDCNRKGYMGLVIDDNSGDNEYDKAWNSFCAVLYQPVNLKGYASRI